MLGCSASGDTPGLIIIDNQNSGLINRHAYSIIDILEIPYLDDEKELKTNYHCSHRLLRIKNPWGHGEWKLKWSENSHFKDLILKHMPYITQYY